MKRSRSALDPGASSSGGSNEANKETIQALRMAFFHVAGLPKSSKSTVLLNQIQFAINIAIEEMQKAEASTNYASIMDDLRTQVSYLVAQSHTELSNNEEHAFINYILALVDFFSRTSNTKIVNKIAASYFEAGAASSFQEGAKLGIRTLSSDIKEMHVILGELKKRNIDPAIKWTLKAFDNIGPRVNWINGALREPERLESLLLVKVARLQFQLCRQDYLEMLKSDGNPIKLIGYLRNNLTSFGFEYLEEVKKLAGGILWTGSLDESPYADLLPSATWETLAKDFSEIFMAVSC